MSEIVVQAFITLGGETEGGGGTDDDAPGMMGEFTRRYNHGR